MAGEGGFKSTNLFANRALAVTESVEGVDVGCSEELVEVVDAREVCQAIAVVLSTFGFADQNEICGNSLERGVSLGCGMGL